MALLMGVRCVQGMAFGSPVVPEENRMLVVRLGSPVTDSKVLSLEKRSSQEMSPSRSRGDAWLPVGHDDHRGSAGLDHRVVKGDGLAAADYVVHGDNAIRARYGHAAAHFARREAVGDGHHPRSRPDDGQVGGHALQGQGHVEGDGLIWSQAPVDETVGKPVYEALQFPVGRDGERASI